MEKDCINRQNNHCVKNVINAPCDKRYCSQYRKRTYFDMFEDEYRDKLNDFLKIKNIFK